MLKLSKSIWGLMQGTDEKSFWKTKQNPVLLYSAEVMLAACNQGLKISSQSLAKLFPLPRLQLSMVWHVHQGKPWLMSLQKMVCNPASDYSLQGNYALVHSQCVTMLNARKSWFWETQRCLYSVYFRGATCYWFSCITYTFNLKLFNLHTIISLWINKV